MSWFGFFSSVRARFQKEGYSLFSSSPVSSNHPNLSQLSSRSMEFLSKYRPLSMSSSATTQAHTPPREKSLDGNTPEQAGSTAVERYLATEAQYMQPTPPKSQEPRDSDHKLLKKHIHSVKDSPTTRVSKSSKKPALSPSPQRQRLPTPQRSPSRDLCSSQPIVQLSPPEIENEVEPRRITAGFSEEIHDLISIHQLFLAALVKHYRANGLNVPARLDTLLETMQESWSKGEVVEEEDVALILGVHEYDYLPEELSKYSRMEIEPSICLVLRGYNVWVYRTALPGHDASLCEPVDEPFLNGWFLKCMSHAVENATANNKQNLSTQELSKHIIDSLPVARFWGEEPNIQWDELQVDLRDGLQRVCDVMLLPQPKREIKDREQVVLTFDPTLTYEQRKEQREQAKRFQQRKKKEIDEKREEIYEREANRALASVNTPNFPQVEEEWERKNVVDRLFDLIPILIALALPHGVRKAVPVQLIQLILQDRINQPVTLRELERYLKWVAFLMPKFCRTWYDEDIEAVILDRNWAVKDSLWRSLVRRAYVGKYDTEDRDPPE